MSVWGSSSTAMPHQPTCRMCGKPEHGSLACSVAPNWPEQPSDLVAYRLDPAAPGGVYDRIASALERIASALESEVPSGD